MSSKLEQFLFYFLFFAIPLQTRKILYSPGWYYNEWQSVSVYATDIILLALFAFWLFNSYSKLSYYVLRITYYGKNFKSLILNTKYPVKARGPLGFSGLVLNPDFYLVLFLIAAGISIKNSSDFYVGVFLWLKLIEFALFYFYLKTCAIRKFDFIKILYALILGGAFQAVIAIGQFLKQGDLGLRWLGESVLGPNMQGVASFLVPSNVDGFVGLGLKVMRAYGTTPHPNVLAAYLFLAVVAIYFVVFYAKSRRYDSLPRQQTGLIYQSIVHGVVLFGLFFTFSRTIIFIFFVNFFARGVLAGFIKRFREKYLFGNFFKKKVLPLFLVTVIATVVFTAFYWPEVKSRMTLSSEEEAVQLRIFYNKESLGGGINFFGIGLGDFTGWLMEQNPNLPRHVYQPVHNIYLLVYSEMGVIGFILFLLFLAGLLYGFVKKTRLCELKHYSFLLVVASILFIGLFDHFLFTIQQGRFVFWLSAALLTFYNSNDTI